MSVIEDTKQTQNRHKTDMERERETHTHRHTYLPSSLRRAFSRRKLCAACLLPDSSCLSLYASPTVSLWKRSALDMYPSSPGLHIVKPAVVSGAFFWCILASQPALCIIRLLSNATLSFMPLRSERVLARMFLKPKADWGASCDAGPCPWSPILVFY